MDDNDRRRYNSEENDYYTNNSRRDPSLPRTYTPSDGVRRDYGTDDRGRAYPRRDMSQRDNMPVRDGYAGRTVPQSGQGAARSFSGASAPQNGYGQYAQRPPYQPSQPQYGQPQFDQRPQYGQPQYVQPQSPAYPQQGAYQRPPYGQGSYSGQPYRPQQQGAGYPHQPQQYSPMDERDFAYENAPAQPVEKKKRGFFGFGKSKKEEVDALGMGNVVITEPKSFDDVRVIIDGLRRRQAIIIDFSRISDKDSQRILDFLSGAIYALGGAQQRINDHMFLFTPEGVMIQGPASLRNKYRKD